MYVNNFPTQCKEIYIRSYLCQISYFDNFVKFVAVYSNSTVVFETFFVKKFRITNLISIIVNMISCYEQTEYELL